MTGGGGQHRGRVTGGPGGTHWWGGAGPAGGGTHAVRPARRPWALLLAALLAVLVVGGVTLAVATTGAEPAPDAARGPVPAAPATTGHPAGARGLPTPDLAVLQSTIDDVLAADPLRFPADSATPTSDTGASIDRLAAVLRATPGPPITVEGHTAPAGEDTEDDQELSQQRAEEIQRRLEAAGVPTGRLTAVGAGDAQPLDTLEASRRVEIRAG